MSVEVEVIADYQTLCGEGPVWDFRRDCLVWDDLTTSRVFEYHPTTNESVVVFNEAQANASGIALNGESGLLFGGSTGLHLWQPDGTYRTLVTEHEGEPLFFNDIIAGPAGRLYGNTMYWGHDGMEKPGKLYRFNPDSSIAIEDEGFVLANGFGFSPDDRTLYMADSIERVIYAYDVDAASGALSNRRIFATVPAEDGIPDGLTVDREGFMWSAQWYGGQVLRYDPEGKIERRIALPAKQVSSLMFGGPDLADLYITTAAETWPSEWMPPGYDPHSGLIGGALYRVRPNIQGRREHVAALR